MEKTALYRNLPFFDSFIWQIIFVIFGYAAIIYILIKIHKKISQNKIHAEKECILEYDHIIYMIAKQEYMLTNTMNTMISSSNLFQKLLQSHDKNYLKNHQLIIDTVKEFEKSNNQVLLTPVMEKKIEKLRKKIISHTHIQRFLGIFLNFTTAGVYLLFH